MKIENGSENLSAGLKMGLRTIYAGKFTHLPLKGPVRDETKEHFHPT